MHIVRDDGIDYDDGGGGTGGGGGGGDGSAGGGGGVYCRLTPNSA